VARRPVQIVSAAVIAVSRANLFVLYSIGHSVVFSQCMCRHPFCLIWLIGSYWTCPRHCYSCLHYSIRSYLQQSIAAL